MKKIVCLAGCLLLAACATDTGNAPPPPPAQAQPVQKPVSTVFKSWYQQRSADVLDARALEDAVHKFKGMFIEAEIGKVAQKNDEGQVVAVDIWKGINLGVPPTHLKRRSAELQKSVGLVAEFAGLRSAPTRIEVYVSDADKPVIRKWLDAGLAKGRSDGPAIEWKKLVKKTDLPFIRVEPVDPHYAFGPLT